MPRPDLPPSLAIAGLFHVQTSADAILPLRTCPVNAGPFHMSKRIQTLKPLVQTLASPPAPTLERPSSSTKRGYNYRWQRYREHWLTLYPMCGDRVNGPSAEHSECRRKGLITAATDVDHIERVHGARDDRFWDSSNHQSLCHACHSMKTQAEQG